MYERVRPDNIEALRDYVRHGTPVGDFLRAVLENNLMEAFGRADDYNRETLFDICNFVYNEIPFECHGSPERYKNWILKFTKEKK